MPALSAREMLARLPVRNMARGGSVGEDYTEGLGDLDAQIQADIEEERRLRAEEAAAREAAAKAEADAKAAAEAKAAADKAAADAAEKAAKDAADKAAAEAKAAADKAAEEAAAAAAKAEADAAAAKAAADAAAKAEADAAAKLAGDINLSAEAAYDKSAAYKRAQETGGSQGVLQYYEDLRTLADKYMAGEGQFEGNQPVGADAYNAMLESGISNTDLINAGVGDDVLTKIWTTASSDPTLDSPTDVESAYMTNSVLAAEAARISAEGRDGVAALQAQGKAYVEDAQKDGLTQDEINTLRELALEGGYTLDDIRAAGVDPSILFYVPEKKKEEATTKVCPEGTRLAGQTVGINADCGTITKATTKVCPEGTRLAGQTVDINADCGTITTGPTTKVCPQGTQLAGQTVDINADCGTITGPTTKVCPEGTQFAGQTVDINTDCGTLTNPSTPQIKICPPGTKRAGEQIPVSMPCGVLEPRTKLCPAGTIKAGQYIAESEDCGTPFPEVVTDTGTGADSATGVVTYDPVAFEKEQAGADIYEKGQPALDVAFRESDPRTEVTQDIFGEQQLVGFDYLPAAQLLSATGSGFSFTPPSVTSRPRTLMPTSQLGRYTRGRAAQDLQQLLGPNRAISFPDASGQMQQTTLYDRYKPLLDRGGSYGGGLSRSQLYALMRRQEAEDAQRLGIGAYTPGTVPTQAAQAQTATGTIADYIALNPDVQEDFISQSESGAIPGISLEQFALDHYNKFGLDEMAKGMRTPFSLTGGYTGTTTGFNAPITPYDFGPSGGVRFFADGGNVVKKPEAVPVAQEPRDTAQTESASMLQNIMSGAKQIPSTVYEYGRDIATSEAPLSELGEDVSFLGKSIYAGLREDPVGFTLDMIPVVGEIRSGMDVDKYSDLANQAEAAGNTELANTYRQIVAMAATGVAPLAGMGARAGKRAAISAAEEAATTSARAMLDDIAETAGTRAVPEVQPTQPIAFSDAYAQEIMTTLPEPVNTDLYKGADVAKSQWLTSPEGQTFNRQIAADPEGMIARYNAIPDTEGGKVLDTDLFRELSPNYLADRTLATEIHEAASALNKGLYERRLAETAGQEGTWVFTGGGPASGKSSGPAKAMRADADLIYDGSMANFDAMAKRIDSALDSGKNAKLVFIDRAPEKAIGLAVGRAMDQARRFGSGRTIPKDEFVRMHMESRETIKKLAERYKDFDNVDITVIDNNGVQGQEFIKSIEDIPDLDYNESLKRVEEALEEMRSEGEGRISQNIYDGFNQVYRQEQATQPSGERAASQVEQGVDGRNAEQATQRAEPLGVGVDESLAGGQRLKNYGTEQLDLMDSLATNATAGTRAADALINAPVEAGTKVGIRLNLNSRIPDAPRGLDKLQTLHKNNFNGKALSYVPYATVENGTFNVSQTGRRNIAAKISGMDVPEAKAKFPAMSVDGSYAPDRNVLREGGEVIEVGFNPAAHHLFIDMNTGQAVKSFDVATVVGDRVYAKGVTYHKKSEAPEPVAASDGTELPSNVRYREMSKGGIVDRKEDNRTYI